MNAWQIQHFDEVASTQDVALNDARLAVPAGKVIVAALQSKGRGRAGNEWQSIRGNLLCSILLRPEIAPSQSGQYSFLSAVALNRTLSELVSPAHHVQNKWPNDVLIDGRKIAGILLEAVLDEASLDALVIGLGVNITAAPDDKIALNDVATEAHTSEDFLEGFLGHLAAVIDEYDANGFSGLREEWLRGAIGLGHAIKVRLPGVVIEGVFEGLDEAGALRLRLANGDLKVIHSGEVFFG